MKQIEKQNEPIEFIQWKTANQAEISRFISEKKTGEEIWGKLQSSLSKDSVPNDYSKALLRASLTEEQYYLCCYCNDAIKGDANDTKLEHFLPKEKYKESIFEYVNLFAVCKGGEKDTAKPHILNCDSHKRKNDPLDYDIISPLSDNVHTHFAYRENGEIIGETEQGKNTIHFLNLDCKRLNLRRKAVIEDFIYNEDKDIEELIEEALYPIDGKLQAFCMAIISILESYR